MIFTTLVKIFYNVIKILEITFKKNPKKVKFKFKL